MKVLLSFPGCHRRGGVERIVFECGEYLARRGHEVAVLASDIDPQLNQAIQRQPAKARNHPAFLKGYSYYRQASSCLDNIEFDVLNVHGCVCPIGGVHWSQSLHAAWLDRARQFRKPWTPAWVKQRLNPLHPVLLSLERHHFRERNYQHVIVTTAQVKADLEHYYEVLASDVTIIPNGFSPTEFNSGLRSARRAAVRHKFGLTDENIALLFVANELERKGYDTILGALGILKNPNIKLLVVGRASMDNVRRRAAQHCVTDQVVACGATSNVSEYHAAADLFVLPTQYEAFCLAILEALGSGLPVVTSNVPGAADAILPGVNGSLVEDPLNAEELAAALKPLLDPSLRQQFADRTPATVDKYQWPRVLEAYEDVLKRFAKNACSS